MQGSAACSKVHARSRGGRPRGQHIIGVHISSANASLTLSSATPATCCMYSASYSSPRPCSERAREREGVVSGGRARTQGRCQVAGKGGTAANKRTARRLLHDMHRATLHDANTNRLTNRLTEPPPAAACCRPAQAWCAWTRAAAARCARRRQTCATAAAAGVKHAAVEAPRLWSCPAGRALCLTLLCRRARHPSKPRPTDAKQRRSLALCDALFDQIVQAGGHLLCGRRRRLDGCVKI